MLTQESLYRTLGVFRLELEPGRNFLEREKANAHGAALSLRCIPNAELKSRY